MGIDKRRKSHGSYNFLSSRKSRYWQYYSSKEVEILEEDNFQTLHDKLAKVGSELVLETVKRIEAGNFETIPQKDEEATLAPKITKEICQINWNHKAERIHNLVRTFTITSCTNQIEK